MIGRFPALVRCDGPNGCDALVEPHAARCSYCANRHGQSPNATGLPSHVGGTVRAGPNPKPAKPENPPLVPCIGIDGSGCRDGATVARLGKRKRCQRCQAELEGKRSDAARSTPSGSMPFHILQAQRRRERERARRPVKGGGVR